MVGAARHGIPSVWALLFLSSLLLLPPPAASADFSHCGGCDDADDAGLWATDNILQCQKVSDFLIAAAYFSIPLELLYFATCSDLFPLKWIVLQFGAFIVLCGLTHLITVFTYEPQPNLFHLVLALTVAKFLTALVSFATAITLLTLIPQLLRVKVRENFLMNKARELDREVGMMKRKEEASWHVRMLTQEIRKSLDRHTILYTTMVELSKTLELQNCAVWMPDDSRSEMILTHQLRERDIMDPQNRSIRFHDPDVLEIKATKDAIVLGPESALGVASRSKLEAGPVAAIRMPMLSVSNFKGGTPEVMETSYAILVLVLPNDGSLGWGRRELEIVEVVADQVAVALSHAALLEESQLMREKLSEQHRDLLRAKHEAMRAGEARNSFQSAMYDGMRRPMHSILGLVSMMQQESMNPEQRLVMDAIAKTSSVASTLMNDVMQTSTMNHEHLSLVRRPFNLHSLIKEAVGVVRCLAGCVILPFRPASLCYLSLPRTPPTSPSLSSTSLPSSPLSSLRRPSPGPAAGRRVATARGCDATSGPWRQRGKARRRPGRDAASGTAGADPADGSAPLSPSLLCLSDSAAAGSGGEGGRRMRDPVGTVGAASGLGIRRWVPPARAAGACWTSPGDAVPEWILGTCSANTTSPT